MTKFIQKKIFLNISCNNPRTFHTSLVDRRVISMLIYKKVVKWGHL